MSSTNTLEDRKKAAWYWPTIGKFLVALFTIELLLYVSEQFRWFEFNRHKNWTVLINVAAVATGLLLMVLWIVGAALFKRRPQFGLGTLMGLLFVVGLACGWLSREIANTRSQADVKKEFAGLGLTNSFDFVRTSSSPTETTQLEGVQLMGAGLSAELSADSVTPALLRKWFGEDFFSSIKNVTFGPNNDEEALRGVEALTRMTDVRELMLHGPNITDATLFRLGEVPSLELLTINGASLSNDGLRHLLLQKNLRAIGLHGVSIDDVGLKNLEELKRLNSLDVRRASITDAGIARLAHLKRLKLVFVEDTLVTEQGISQLQSALPDCRITMISGGKIQTIRGGRR